MRIVSTRGFWSTKRSALREHSCSFKRTLRSSRRKTHADGSAERSLRLFIQRHRSNRKARAEAVQIFVPHLEGVWRELDISGQEGWWFARNQERVRHFLLEIIAFFHFRKDLIPLLRQKGYKGAYHSTRIFSRHEFSLPVAHGEHSLADFYLARVQKKGNKTELIIFAEVDCVWETQDEGEAIAIAKARRGGRQGLHHFNGKAEGLTLRTGEEIQKIRLASEVAIPTHWVTMAVTNVPQAGRFVEGCFVHGIGRRLKHLEFTAATIARRCAREEGQRRVVEQEASGPDPLSVEHVGSFEWWNRFVTRVARGKPEIERLIHEKGDVLIWDTVKGVQNRFLEKPGSQRLDYFESIRQAIRSGLGETVAFATFYPMFGDQLEHDANTQIVIGREIRGVNFRHRSVKCLERLGDVVVIRFNRGGNAHGPEQGTAHILAWAEVKVLRGQGSDGAVTQIESRLTDLGIGGRIIYPNSYARRGEWWTANQWRVELGDVKRFIFCCSVKITLRGRRDRLAPHYRILQLGLGLHELQHVAHQLALEIFGQVKGFDEISEAAMRLPWAGKRPGWFRRRLLRWRWGG